MRRRGGAAGSLRAALPIRQQPASGQRAKAASDVAQQVAAELNEQASWFSRSSIAGVLSRDAGSGSEFMAALLSLKPRRGYTSSSISKYRKSLQPNEALKRAVPRPRVGLFVTFAALIEPRWRCCVFSGWWSAAERLAEGSVVDPLVRLPDHGRLQGLAPRRLRACSITNGLFSMSNACGATVVTLRAAPTGSGRRSRTPRTARACDCETPACRRCDACPRRRSRTRSGLVGLAIWRARRRPRCSAADWPVERAGDDEHRVTERFGVEPATIHSPRGGDFPDRRSPPCVGMRVLHAIGMRQDEFAKQAFGRPAVVDETRAAR